jgi:hypothetical protein
MRYVFLFSVIKDSLVFFQIQISNSEFFQACDFLEDPLTGALLQDKYDLVLDKGTYDAISLNPDNPQEKRTSYVRSLCHILRPNGLFIITSCNWTEEELRAHFGEGMV